MTEPPDLTVDWGIIELTPGVVNSILPQTAILIAKFTPQSLKPTTKV